MNDQNSEEFPELDSESLRSLSQEMEAPAELEERVVSTLKQRGLIQAHRAYSLAKTIAAIAAGIVFFSVGLWTGLHQQKDQNGITMSESTFVIFLIQGPSYRDASTPQEESLRIDEYRNWARKIRQEGIPLSGIKLHPETSFLGTFDVPDRVGSGIAGYFLVEADDFARAAAIAGSCPHLQYGGQIEIRRIQPA